MTKIEKVIDGWMYKLLPKRGKETLLKVVVQAIPIYTVSVFLITPELCERMERKMNKYWWSHNRDGIGILVRNELSCAKTNKPC